MKYCNYSDIFDLIDRQTLLALLDENNEFNIDIFDLFLQNTFHTDHAFIVTVIENSVKNAESIVDGYCSPLYSVPFVTVPKIITMITVDLAIYDLFSRGQQDMPEIRKERYNSAIDLLKKINSGLLSLDIKKINQTVFISSNKPFNLEAF